MPRVRAGVQADGPECGSSATTPLCWEQTVLLLERAAAGTAWAKGFCDLPLASVLLAVLQGWTRSWVVAPALQLVPAEPSSVGGGTLVPTLHFAQCGARSASGREPNCESSCAAAWGQRNAWLCQSFSGESFNSSAEQGLLSNPGRGRSTGRGQFMLQE